MERAGDSVVGDWTAAAGEEGEGVAETAPLSGEPATGGEAVMRRRLAALSVGLMDPSCMAREGPDVGDVGVDVGARNGKTALSNTTC
jgi:hypothetical protein